ncbi:MAG: GNAT family N-acetyltransferase [Kiritimatiellia bacterium]
MSPPTTSVSIEIAVPADLDRLFALEQQAFPAPRQESRAGILRSIQSPHQELWVMEGKGFGLAGSMTLRLSPKSLRIYSIAIDPRMPGRGLGERFLTHAEARAAGLRKTSIRLEADARNLRLLNWYARRGYHFFQRLEDYYGPGSCAHRLVKTL